MIRPRSLPLKGAGKNCRYAGKHARNDWISAPDSIGLTTPPLSSTAVGPDLVFVWREARIAFG